MLDPARKLIVVPCCGLGNRILVITCGQLLAEDSGRVLYVDWTPVDNCAIELTELFVPSFQLLSELPEDTVCYSSLQRRLEAVPEKYLDLLKRPTNVRFGRLPVDPADTIAIFTCHQFLDYYNDPRFPDRLRAFLGTARPEIVAEVNDFAERHFDDATVGVHVRRTDFRSQKGVSHYLKQMRRFGDVTFFISTDDPAVTAEIRQHYPRAVEYSKSSLSRQESSGLVQALIDMLLLSRTSYLIGTQGSSFTGIARAAGGTGGKFNFGQSISLRDLQLGKLRNMSRKIVRRYT